MILPTDDPLAVAVVEAIHRGDVEGLVGLLVEHPGLATARLGDDDPDGMSRSLLHIATDWPGHFPRVAATIAALVAAGARADVRFHGPHEETPLHWAASSDDVAALDALLDAGADIDALGAVIGGGTPLADARAFGNRAAALRLVERGATVTLHDAATLGLVDRVRGFLDATPGPSAADVDTAFWSACHGGSLPAAELLHAHGADLDVVPPWEPQTPLDVAARAGAHDVVTWLHERGARTHGQLSDC